MANRRMGGGIGANRSGGRPYSQQQQHQHQHQPPYQSNVSPWQGPNSANQGLLNQLSNPQQLAAALTNLLQSQQRPDNPPSLLSLNAGPGGYRGGRLGSGPERFGNRGGPPDFRRFEPYNKGRFGGGGGGGGGGGNYNNNWRNQSFPRGPNRDRRPSNFQRNERKKEEPKGDAKKIDKNESKNESKNEEGSPADTKRDWKNEKKNSDEACKDGAYVGIPPHLLHCFVCSKEMWDGESFQKHIGGKAHKQMVDNLEESFHIIVNILRESMKLSEEKKLIELTRKQRLNKKGKVDNVESYCNMCDFRFLGKIVSHRRTDEHQRLKRFLHPNCSYCSKEFPSRMDWVHHRLTPEHMQGVAAFLEKAKSGGVDGAEIVSEDQLEIEIDSEIMPEETEDVENPVTEITDDLTDLEKRIPPFSKNNPVGEQSVQEFSGFICDICNKTFISEELGKAHLKSVRHYHKFVEIAKDKFLAQVSEDKKAKELKLQAKKDEEKEGDKTEEDSEMYDPEDPSKVDESKDEEMEDEVEEEEQEVQAVEEQEEEKEEVTDEVEEPKVEEQSQPAAESTPNPRPRRTGAVRNGAGPKSKKLKK